MYFMFVPPSPGWQSAPLGSRMQGEESGLATRGKGAGNGPALESAGECARPGGAGRPVPIAYRRRRAASGRVRPAGTIVDR
jgi:hypothetical protein